MTMDEELDFYAPNVVKDDLGRKFYIGLNNLYVGWMELEFIVDGEKIPQSFDEAFDHVWELMEVYIAVRDYGKDHMASVWEGDKASWRWNDDDYVKLQLIHLKDDCFQLQIKVEFCEGKPEIFEKSINLTKAELLNALDEFFHQILNNKGFPLQYPAGCRDYEEETEDKADAVLEEILQLLPDEIKKRDDISMGLEVICTNALVKPTAETQEYIDDYRAMLEKHELPEWFVW